MLCLMLDLQVDTELGITSSPDLINEIRIVEREISRGRARQVRLLRELMRRRPFSEPAVSFSEIAAELDVSPNTARALLETATRSPERSERIARLESGDWSFDRAVAMARLFAAGADDATMRAADERDIAGVHKLRGMTRRVRRRDERQAHEERYLRCSPSLDESVGFIHGQLGGFDWQVVSRALDNRVDQFPKEARVWSREQRRADALVAIAQDWLNGGLSEASTSGPIITVMVEAMAASQTQGEAGVTISGGPRVGPDTLDRILCEGSVEVMIDDGSGKPLAVGPTTRVVPPKVRRFVLHCDGGCTIDGCTSRYRLEVHHIVPRSEGGTHDVDNLTTLCWWHHHIAIHGRGYRIDPTSPPKRRRVIPAGHDPTKDPP